MRTKYQTQAGQSMEFIGSMSVCDAAQWVKLSDSWPKFSVADFQLMLFYIT
jgi:hypothetical protein